MSAVSRCLALLAVASAVACERADAPPARPNVLVLVADDLACSAVGSFGGRAGLTPAIDRLAREGVSFRNAYCASTYCTPSRQAFLTGQWPHRLGVTRLLTPMPPDTVTLGTVFREAGYDTAAIGKMHWNRQGTAADFGFDRILERKDWRAQLTDSELKLVEAHRHQWTDHWNGIGGRYRGGAVGVPAERLESIWIVDRAIEFLDQERARPFFAVCSFSPPHFPFTYPTGFVSVATPADFEAPPFDHEEQRRNVPGIDPVLPGGGALEPNDARHLRAHYARSVAWVDYCIGVLLNHLDETGLADETVVVLWSDHGYLLGEHGLVGKRAAYREVVRVPLVLRIPGRAAGATDGFASLIDVFPTLCDLAGIATPAGLDGASLLPALDGETDFPDSVFVELPGTLGVLQTDDWKLVLGARRNLGLDQLYDLRGDPGERRNLYTPDNEPVIRELVDRMHTFLAAAPPTTGAPDWLDRPTRLAAVRSALLYQEPEVERPKSGTTGADIED